MPETDAPQIHRLRGIRVAGRTKPETIQDGLERGTQRDNKRERQGPGTRVRVSHIYSNEKQETEKTVIPLKIRRDKPRNLSDHRGAPLRRDGSGSRAATLTRCTKRAL
jgi:hypothetical protein